MLDQGLAAYLAIGPDTVSLKLDWGERLVADLVTTRDVPEADLPPDPELPTEDDGHTLPPALAALVEERRAAHQAAVEAAIRGAAVVLPAATWREIQDRAASVGVEAELRADGAQLHLASDLPPLDGSSAASR
jgi:hypothetical protein